MAHALINLKTTTSKRNNSISLSSKYEIFNSTAKLTKKKATKKGKKTVSKWKWRSLRGLGRCGKSKSISECRMKQSQKPWNAKVFSKHSRGQRRNSHAATHIKTENSYFIIIFLYKSRLCFCLNFILWFNFTPAFEWPRHKKDQLLPLEVTQVQLNPFAAFWRT